MNEVIVPGTPQTEDTPEVLKAKIAQLESDKLSVVNELTDNRPKLREANDKIATLQALLQQATEKNNTTPEKQQIMDVVKEVLSGNEQLRAQNNRKAAFDRFVSEHKEYHPDNDPNGLKRGALEREFGNFNSAGAVEVDDFLALISKANVLLRGNTPPKIDPTEQPYSSIPSSTPTSNPGNDPELTSKEEELIRANGFTKERFLELKTKMPGFIEGLLE